MGAFRDQQKGGKPARSPAGCAPLADWERSVLAQLDQMIDAEVTAAPRQTRQDRETVSAFREALVPPYDTEVHFSGGITQRCWTVTRSDGTYRVVYLPSAGYFALCVESALGPLDIGVHGPAMGCFATV